MPAGLAKLVGEKGVNWDYNTAPEPQPGGRRLWWPRGKVLGGSSSINAMCYIRGHTRDYDEWDDARRQRLGLGQRAALLPALGRQQPRRTTRLHGDDGPLARVRPAPHQPAVGGVRRGRRTQAGHARSPTTSTASTRTASAGTRPRTRDGARSSAAEAYLKPARKRRNLTRDHRRAGSARAVRGRPRQRRRLPHRRQGVRRTGAARSAAVRRRAQFAAAADAVRHRPGRSTCASTASRCASTCPASAATCRTTSTSAPCSAARSRSPTTRPTTSRSALRVLPVQARARAPATSPRPAASCARACAEDARPDIQFHFVPAQLDDHGRHQPARLRLHRCTPASCARAAAAALRWPAPTRPTRCASRPTTSAMPDGRDLRMMLECVKLSRADLRAAGLRALPRRGTVPRRRRARRRRR